MCTHTHTRLPIKKLPISKITRIMFSLLQKIDSFKELEHLTAFECKQTLINYK